MRDTKNYGSKTLKGRNLAWLVATLILDFLVLLVLAFHTAIEDLTPTRLAAVRASLTALLPIPVLIFSSLISADHKAILVFWRSVVDSHKNYLLFRDIAAMSLLLVPIVPAVMYFSGLDTPRILISTAWFLGQYLVAAFAARTTGIRFVQNVLAVHASRKVTNSRKKEADG